MKPYQTLLFLVSIFAALAILMFVFPKNGIKITDQITFQFTNYNEVFSVDSAVKTDEKHLPQNDTIMRQVPLLAELMTNRIKDDTTLYHPPSTGGFADTVFNEFANISTSQRIQFPEGNKRVLYAFFEALQRGNELIRVMHYGDSQLEGDRITSFIRNQLQTQFGGSGVGLLPLKQAHNYQTSIKHNLTGNWSRYNVKQHARIIKSRRFGAVFSFARFAPLRVIPGDIEDMSKLNDSSLTGLLGDMPTDGEEQVQIEYQIDTAKIVEGTFKYNGAVHFEAAKNTYSNHRKFNLCRIFYGYNQEPVVAELYGDGETPLQTAILPPNKSFNELTWEVNSPQKLTIRFKGNDSPEFYGIAFDATKGIAVDNISSRGSAGLDFMRVNQTHLKQMYEKLGVKLLILQFGGNVTPYITKNYDYYKKLFASQIEGLRRIIPNVCIVVIGPADMSRKVGEKYVSYPNIPDIRNALREAAFSNGAAFWDMYEAMGGENSMSEWVFAEPALAAKDFTHFSHEGAKVIAKLFYNSLITEYNEYMQHNRF